MVKSPAKGEEMDEDLTKKLPSTDSEKLGLILTTVQSLEGRIENLETRGDRIDSRLANLEQSVEDRLYDTRPIWEKVLVDISQLQAGLVQLQEGQEFLRNESREIKTFLRDIFQRLSIFNDTMVTMQADYRDIYDRVRGLELNRN
jgi:chromosome segregation ATPase